MLEPFKLWGIALAVFSILYTVDLTLKVFFIKGLSGFFGH